VITIDDGFAEAARHAMEVLPRYAFTATVFLVAGAMGAYGMWVERAEMPLAGWAAAREMIAAGFTCGSHSLTHPRLADLRPDACARELRESRKRLEDGLGVPVRHLAYPYGSVDETVRKLAAEAGYSTGCGVSRALSVSSDSPLNLPRVPVIGGESLADFACRLRTARPMGDLVRAGLRKLLPSDALAKLRGRSISTIHGEQHTAVLRPTAGTTDTKAHAGATEPPHR
jgi:peptidoglycan/xylan/chitin deacetylase (PgdA/CDA1 family)